MNYFELYKIQVSFNPDLTVVKKQFYVLSRQYHPDFFGAADEDQKNESLELTAQVNKAFKTFQDADAIIQYILSLHNLIEAEEKYQLAPDFLMEVMDLNEQVMELEHQNSAVKNSIQSSLNHLKASIYEPIKSVMANYQENTYSEKELLQIKDYYYKKKYLDRIEEEIM
jgi:molecular chaperone HscB